MTLYPTLPGLVEAPMTAIERGEKSEGICIEMSIFCFFMVVVARAVVKRETVLETLKIWLE